MRFELIDRREIETLPHFVSGSEGPHLQKRRIQAVKIALNWSDAASDAWRSNLKTCFGEFEGVKK